MTLQQAKSIARHVRLSLRTVRPGAYRVNFRDGNAATDAVNAAVAITRRRDARQ